MSTAVCMCAFCSLIVLLWSVQEAEPTGAATIFSGAAGSGSAMHWKKAYKTRAATSAGCEDDGKTIVEDDDRSDGALAEVLCSGQGIAVSTLPATCACLQSTLLVVQAVAAAPYLNPD